MKFFRDFYHFCAERFQSKQMKDRFYIMIRCKNVRNACAHNDCFINDLHINTAAYPPKYTVNKALSKIRSLSRDSRMNRMGNERIQELIYVLCIHNDIVTSTGVHQRILKNNPQRSLRQCGLFITFAFADNFCIRHVQEHKI